MTSRHYMRSIAGISPRDFRVDHLTAEDFDGLVKFSGSMWTHSGNPKSPHVELTSGRHSDGYFNFLVFLSYTNICEILAQELVRIWEQYCEEGGLSAEVDWVVGSSYAAIDLSHSVARRVNARHGFTQKEADGTQSWKLVIEPDEVVLQVEDLITTAKTLRAVREGIRRGNPSSVTFAPASLVCVDRSDVEYFEGSPIISFTHYDTDIIQSWDPDSCPLCKAGSKAIRPKENWGQLVK